MPTHLMSQAISGPERRPHGVIRLSDEIALTRARVHEVCGPARRSFALWLAGQMRGPVLWIEPGRGSAGLNPNGMTGLLDPVRLLLVQAPRDADLLWSMEEALRAGAAPLVVADLPAPPALTPVRRLHLAAQTGAGKSAEPPLGLLMTPGDGGAPGVETRWHMAPRHSTDSRARTGTDRWHLSCTRDRTRAPHSWTLERQTDRQGLRVLSGIRAGADGV